MDICTAADPAQKTAPKNSRLSLALFDSDGALSAQILPSLYSLNFEITLFSRSGDLLKAIQQRPVDLVLICQSVSCDRYLRLCNSLQRRESKQNHWLPVLMLAHEIEPKAMQEALAAGVTEILSASSQPEELIETLSGLIYSSRQPFQSELYGDGQKKLPDDHGLKVLVAEDAKLYQAFYRIGLERLHCSVEMYVNGQDALNALRNEPLPDLIITDINMPKMDGQTLVRKIRADHRLDAIPVVISTSIQEEALLNELFDVGANDYLTKPMNEKVFCSRISAHLANRLVMKRERELNLELEKKVLERTQQLYESRVDVIYKLAKACEYKDDDTGYHIHRVGAYTEALAQACGVESGMVEEMRYGSLMHDLGKMGIPDSILQKNGKLTPAERKIMETHARIGEKILGEQPFFKQAVYIAGGHHEKWDGSGYPRGLQGEEIPLAARIVAVADVFDALLSRRPYKAPKTLEQSLQIMLDGRGKHFDPNLLDRFFELVDNGTITSIMKRFPYE